MGNDEPRGIVKAREQEGLAVPRQWRGEGQQGEQAPSLGMVWKVEAGYQSLMRTLIRSQRGRWLLTEQQLPSPLPTPAA